MNHIQRMVVLGLSLGSTSAFAGTIVVSPKTELRNSKGFFRCTLWSQGEGFPIDYDKADQRISAPISDAQSTCTFENVQPGKYAIALLHDENDDKKMETTPVGVPVEGFGFSNDATPMPGQTPAFQVAAFDYDGSTLNLQLDVRYAKPL